MSYKRVFAKGRHAKTRQKVILSGFRMATFRPARQKYEKQKAKIATHEKCRNFVWRGERLPCENTKKSPFGGFSRGAFSPRKHDNTTWHKSANIDMGC